MQDYNDTVVSKPKIVDPTDDRLDVMVGSLPDLFRMNDGSKVSSKEDWKKRRQELLDQVVEIGFGGIPPKPEVFYVEELSVDDIQITAGTNQSTITFELQIYKPSGTGKHPVLLTADCHAYLNDNIIQMFRERGFVVARFNRGVLAGEMTNGKRDKGLYPVYPDLKFGTIAAWAWGYHRCIDALEQLDYVDMDCICISGHSRGGKATLLAAATDERIAYAHASGSGQMGGGCIRYTQHESSKWDLGDYRAETLANMHGIGTPSFDIRFWIGEKVTEYIDREDDLPFDLHSLKALVAPRGFLETNGLEDIWANPRGCYHTFRAAREAYRFLEAPEMIASVYRWGGHSCTYHDYYAFLNFIETTRVGRPFVQQNADTIFGNLPKVYDWGIG